jgi:hypothetical protein
LTPEADKVRETLSRRQWAEQVADREYGPHHGDSYRYTKTQRARNARKKTERIRWLMKRPPILRPVLPEKEREASLRSLRKTPLDTG